MARNVLSAIYDVLRTGFRPHACTCIVDVFTDASPGEKQMVCEPADMASPPVNLVSVIQEESDILL